MKKTILSLAVAAVFAFAIVACGGQTTDTEPELMEDAEEWVDEHIEDIEPEIDDFDEFEEVVEEMTEEVID